MPGIVFFRSRFPPLVLTFPFSLLLSFLLRPVLSSCCGSVHTASSSFLYMSSLVTVSCVSCSFVFVFIILLVCYGSRCLFSLLCFSLVLSCSFVFVFIVLLVRFGSRCLLFSFYVSLSRCLVLLSLSFSMRVFILWAQLPYLTGESASFSFFTFCPFLS